MRSVIGALVVGVLVYCAVSPAATNKTLPRSYGDPNGDTHVVCLANSSQSYELYIPPSVNPSAPSPILYGFDPGGDGKATLKVLAPAAAANGWILAVSNNSRNGPWDVIFAAQDAVLQDTETRLNLHPTRRFASGFSGGARASLALAFRYPSKICGVLCQGAGWPVNTTLVPSNDRLVVRILIGTQDSNYTGGDIERTQAQLVYYGVRCVVETYNGGHVWPPAAMILSAAQWLNENAEKDPNANLVPETRPDESLFCQLPDMPADAWVAFYSDEFYDTTMLENFEGIARPITTVDWWGITSRHSGIPAEPLGDQFILRFYADASGVPGSLVREETVNATRNDRPPLFENNYALRRYSARLSSPLNLSQGWLNIEHVATADSVFFWLSSSQGDNQSWVRVTDLGELEASYDDLAFSLDTDKLVCDFTASPEWGALPHHVTFHGAVSGALEEAVSWQWDFGDGQTETGTSTATHEYVDPGMYTVTLTVTTPTRADAKTKTNYILAAESLPAQSRAAIAVLTAALLGLGVRLATRRRSRRGT